MDLQLGPSSRTRIRLSPEETLRAVMDQAPRAEALASHCIVSTRPVWSWIAPRWRRLGTLAVLLLIIGLLLHVVFGANGMVVYREKRDELKTLRSEVDRIQKENEEYSQRIKALKSDPSAIEKEAREQLHYTRPGEMIYIFPEAAPKPPVGRAKSGK